MTGIDFQLVADIINKHLETNGFGHIMVDPQELEWPAFVEEWGMICPGEPFNDFFTRLFQIESPDHSETKDLTLYHFKDASTAMNIIQSQTLQLSFLPAQSDNDNQEFSYYLKQIGHELALGKPVPEKLKEAYPEGFLTIEDMRRGVYAYCFTKTDLNERFWHDYADKHTGVCFKFKYSSTGDRKFYGFFPSYSLRNMIYDNESGNKFGFIQEMNKELKARVGYELMATEAPHFAVYFKQSSFSWEDEIRLSVDVAYLDARNIEHQIYPKTSQDGKRNFIPIPIKGNDLFFFYEFPFDLELIEVQCGEHMTMEVYAKIVDLVAKKYPLVPVIKRNNSI
jgi:hypothetical protein